MSTRRRFAALALVLSTSIAPLSRGQDRPTPVRNWLRERFSARVARQADQRVSEALPLLSAGGIDQPGLHDVKIMHGGVERTALVHVPKGYTGTAPVPLVLFFHGGFGTAQQGARTYGWRELADSRGFVAVFPDGLSRSWNAVHGCGPSFLRQVDDVGFVGALIDGVAARLRIDPRRIYATGMSNGGMLSHRLGIELAPRLAAIAPVAGAVGGSSRGVPHPPPAARGPMPVLIVHGRKDRNVPYDGGAPIAGFDKGRKDMSVAESVQYWVAANHAASTPTRTTSDGGNIVRETWAGPGGADVVLITVENGGHAWPGSLKGPLAGLLTDSPTNALDTTAAIWEFFAAHPRSDPSGTAATPVRH